MKGMSVRVEVDLFDRFRVACEPFTVSAVIKRLMEKFIKGEIGLD